MLSKKLKGALLTASLVLSSLITPLTASAQETWTIAGNLELTGNAAAYATPVSRSMELAVEQVNANGGILEGDQLAIEVIDNKSDTTEATSVARRIGEIQNLVGIIGPNSTTLGHAITPTVSEGEAPMIYTSTTGDGLTLDDAGTAITNIFRVCFENSYQGAIAGEYAMSKLDAPKAVVIIDQAMDYSQGLADAFVAKYEELGGEVVSYEAYQSGDADFQALATTLASYDFDVIYLPGYYTETGLIVKQIREMGLTQPIIGGDGYANETFVELAGSHNLNDLYITSHYYDQTDRPEAQEFIAAYEEKFGERPDSFAALGYDAIMLLVDAIERAGTTEAAAVNKALQETTDYAGVTGDFTMNANHNPDKPAIMLEYQGGKVVSAEEITTDYE